MWGTGIPVSFDADAPWTTDLVYQTGKITYPVLLQNASSAFVQTQIATPGNETETTGILISCVKQEDGALVRVARNAALQTAHFDIYVRGN